MALADIAKHAGSDSVPLNVVAERQHLSAAYLEQLFAALRRAGLVESVRGRAGGYRLARPAAQIRIADIMMAVDEDTAMTRCHGGKGSDGVGCVGGQRCLTHGLWDALGQHIQAFLTQVTLQDVLDGIPAVPSAVPVLPLTPHLGGAAP
jgi:Rrf2 family transcriptional regulator, iron-sulfur cluster assembly transcription factor